MSEAAIIETFEAVSVGLEAAREMYDSHWWVGLTDEQIFLRQVRIAELVCPYERFVGAAEAVCNGSVFAQLGSADALWRRYVQAKRAGMSPDDSDALRVAAQRKLQAAARRLHDYHRIGSGLYVERYGVSKKEEEDLLNDLLEALHEVERLQP